MHRRTLSEIPSDNSRCVPRVKRLLVNPDDIVSPEHPGHRYKLWPRRKDRVIWPIAMKMKLRRMTSRTTPT